MSTPEITESLHGDLAERPSPAPKATSKSVKAAVPTAPAAIAAHERPLCASAIVDAGREIGFH